MDKEGKRFGNFVIRRNYGIITITDWNAKFCFSVSEEWAVGKMFLAALEMDGRGEKCDFLNYYPASLMLVASTVPDPTFILGLIKLCGECIGRNTDAYGVRGDDSDEAHQAALDDVKDMKELEEEMKQLNEKAE